jgi:hypothetical protein
VSETPGSKIKSKKKIYIYTSIYRYPCKRPWRPVELWDVKEPTLSKQSPHMWWLGCLLYVLAVLYTQKDLLVLISVRLSKPQVHGAAGRVR